MKQTHMFSLIMPSSFKKTKKTFGTTGHPRETKVHDPGVQGAECSGGGRPAALSTFPGGKVHQGESGALFLCSGHSDSGALFFSNFFSVLPNSLQGDDCQLKHVQGYNDLIKISCKFYIQGCCLKGESCPYMHNILPLFYRWDGLRFKPSQLSWPRFTQLMI